MTVWLAGAIGVLVITFIGTVLTNRYYADPRVAEDHAPKFILELQSVSRKVSSEARVRILDYPKLRVLHGAMPHLLWRKGQLNFTTIGSPENAPSAAVSSIAFSIPPQLFSGSPQPPSLEGFAPHLGIPNFLSDLTLDDLDLLVELSDKTNACLSQEIDYHKKNVKFVSELEVQQRKFLERQAMTIAAPQSSTAPAIHDAARKLSGDLHILSDIAAQQTQILRHQDLRLEILERELKALKQPVPKAKGVTKPAEKEAERTSTVSPASSISLKQVEMICKAVEDLIRALEQHEKANVKPQPQSAPVVSVPLEVKTQFEEMKKRAQKDLDDVSEYRQRLAEAKEEITKRKEELTLARGIIEVRFVATNAGKRAVSLGNRAHLVVTANNKVVRSIGMEVVGQDVSIFLTPGERKEIMFRSREGNEDKSLDRKGIDELKTGTATCYLRLKDGDGKDRPTTEIPFLEAGTDPSKPGRSYSEAKSLVLITPPPLLQSFVPQVFVAPQSYVVAPQ